MGPKNRKVITMIIGVPKEIKTTSTRGADAAGARELTGAGHRVLINERRRRLLDLDADYVATERHRRVGR